MMQKRIEVLKFIRKIFKEKSKDNYKEIVLIQKSFDYKNLYVIVKLFYDKSSKDTVDKEIAKYNITSDIFESDLNGIDELNKEYIIYKRKRKLNKL